MTKDLIRSLSGDTDPKHNSSPAKKKDNGRLKNKDQIQIDATVADQYIAYPTNPGLLNECRKKCEGMIDKFFALTGKKEERLQETSESWVTRIFFIMNLLKYAVNFFLLIFCPYTNG